ncbi:hypothetical protein NO263_04150 [Gluconacetobacter entanii]|uniref:Uncharacterized protein n=1 Tax=Gluconacetobacter entanii TaxID=108528 RepID=A0ABT3K2X5_9PROT|nr:hypothetical protein [Gluconacetobacter entanii]MCW4589770.1 hypothetical protein [Gluconacetobacter entanii]MCW4593609.1 hypothetical protein [Gluconacetobacter entanii]NPC90101.1 hypothetical protein [Gluconacetobacter entanii]
MISTNRQIESKVFTEAGKIRAPIGARRLKVDSMAGHSGNFGSFPRDPAPQPGQIKQAFLFPCSEGDMISADPGRRGHDASLAINGKIVLTAMAGRDGGDGMGVPGAKGHVSISFHT